MQKILNIILIALVLIQGMQISVLEKEQNNIYEVLDSIILEYQSLEIDECFTEEDINKIILDNN